MEVGVTPPNEVQKLEEARASPFKRQIEELNPSRRSRRTTREPGRQRGGRPRPTDMVIDTSFTMDVGETVVVGTSRLKGGTKALITLLTAVPPGSGAR